MPVPCHKPCPPLELASRKRGDEPLAVSADTIDKATGDSAWRESRVNLNHQELIESDDIRGLVCEDFDILIIIAEEDKISKCPICREYFSRTFQISDIWWQWFCKNLNGYFGVEETEDLAGNTTGYNTWAYFETKFYYGDTHSYLWHKLNVFSRWIPSTKTTTLIVFDPSGPIKEKLPSPMIKVPAHEAFGDPFWIYESLLGEVLHLQDQSVWMIRDQVRAREKNRALITRPNPDYGHLHEIARHAIHVSESLDVTVKTVESILQQHNEYMTRATDADKSLRRVSKRLRNRLLFLENMLVGLKYRSASNQARLQNEIQLSFNIVAQSDARTSVEIGRAAQKDSAAMKTVAFMTLTFLPATFISAIFSTSFFNFDSELGVWAVSDKIWIYWVVSIPVTFITILLWFFWHRFFPPTLVGHGGIRAIGSFPRCV